MSDDQCRILTTEEVRAVLDLAVRQAQQKRMDSYAKYQQDDAAFNEATKIMDAFERTLAAKERKEGIA